MRQTMKDNKRCCVLLTENSTLHPMDSPTDVAPLLPEKQAEKLVVKSAESTDSSECDRQPQKRQRQHSTPDRVR